jgi:hypothetical protein
VTAPAHNFSRKVGGRHSPCPWLYCQRCGLIYLNNDPTRKAARKPCVDPDVAPAPDWIRNAP